MDDEEQIKRIILMKKEAYSKAHVETTAENTSKSI